MDCSFCDTIHFSLPLTDQKCNDTDIRLVGSSRPNEGRVEFCSEGIWGTVCSDMWDENNALMVCRELGLPTEGEIRHSVVMKTILTTVHFAVVSVIDTFGGGTGPILLDEVDCVGNESSLFECPHTEIESHDYFHHEDVSVKCGEDL